MEIFAQMKAQGNAADVGNPCYRFYHQSSAPRKTQISFFSTAVKMLDRKSFSANISQSSEAVKVLLNTRSFIVYNFHIKYLMLKSNFLD